MFTLQFPIADLKLYIPAYGNDTSGREDRIINEFAPRVKERGYLTKEEFLEVCFWKTPRSKPRCESNEATFIEDVSRVALSTANERLRIEVLTLLNGVQWPTASVILHFFHNSPYPILDFRALQSLGAAQPDFYTFPFWQAYVAECRKLSIQSGLTMRQVDMALWGWSKQQEERTDRTGTV